MPADKNRIAVLALAAGLAGGAVIGAGLGIVASAGAQSPDTTVPATTEPGPTGATPPAGATTPKGSGSNEDPTHEATESPQREADEDAGRAHFGHGHRNEDPAHEATESPEREAQEDSGSGAAGNQPATPSAPAPSTTTVTP